MANIRVDSPISLFDGQALTFKSPANCSNITGLRVYYPDGDATASKVFQFADAHGNNVGGLDLFASNVVVKVILYVTESLAFVQNADTNAYLEGKFEETKNYTDQHNTSTSAHTDIRNLVTAVQNAANNAASAANIINEHWWEVHAYTPPTYKTSTPAKYVGNTYSAYAEYADSFTVADDGTIILVSPISVKLSTVFSNKDASTYKNKYWSGLTSANSTNNLGSSGYIINGIIYIPDPSTMETSSGLTNYVHMTATDETIIYTGVRAVVGGVVDRVHSTNPNAYPDGEELDGQYYVYGGIPLENAVGGKAKIATGSYIGTGTKGADNPNSLTFEFKPKAWGIYACISNGVSKSYIWSMQPWDSGDLGIATISLNLPSSTSAASLYDQTVQYSENTVSWYMTNTHAAYQLNETGTQYFYFAIG